MQRKEEQRKTKAEIWAYVNKKRKKKSKTSAHIKMEEWK